jgi:hypothetical protein
MKTTNTSVSQVSLQKLPDLISGELSEVFIRQCSFCSKKYDSIIENNKLCEKMSGDDGFYCPFCLRNNYHTKIRKDILILSFRAIIGYFYLNNYLGSSHRKMWLIEIQNFITSHKQVGLNNPLFAYDDETMLWFIDFNRIGDTGKRQPLNEVHKTIVNILSCFNLYQTFPEVNVPVFFQKYRKSIDEFYTKRYRPECRPMLIPTFNKCCSIDIKFSSDRLRNFTLYSFENRKNS